MVETVLLAGFVLLIVNVTGFQIYFYFEAKKRLSKAIECTPKNMDALVEARNDEIRKNRKSGKQSSLALAAMTLQMADLLADEREDLWNVTSPWSFSQQSKSYRMVCTWQISMVESGGFAKFIAICDMLFLLTPIVAGVMALIFFSTKHSFERQIGLILKERGDQQPKAA